MQIGLPLSPFFIFTTIIIIIILKFINFNNNIIEKRNIIFMSINIPLQCIIMQFINVIIMGGSLFIFIRNLQ